MITFPTSLSATKHVLQLSNVHCAHHLVSLTGLMWPASWRAGAQRTPAGNLEVAFLQRWDVEFQKHMAKSNLDMDDARWMTADVAEWLMGCFEGL